MFERLVPVILAGSMTTVAHAGNCSADLDGSGATDVTDLLIVLGEWGPCPGCVSDLNGDDVVSVDDLLVVLGEWGPCGCGFEYPNYANELAAKVAVEQLGPAGPVVAPQELYDRFDHDLNAMGALRPEIVGGDHIGDWVHQRLIVGVDTSLPQDEYASTLACYGGKVEQSWFDGTIELLMFPQPINVEALIAIFEAVPAIEYAEPDYWIQLPGAGTPGFFPTDVGFGAYAWRVVVAWWSDGTQCEFGFLCDCNAEYTFVSEDDGTVTLTALQTTAYDWSPPGTSCADIPPAP